MEKVFTAGGYDFYRHADGFWNCVHAGASAPNGAGGYWRVASLAKLKGIALRLLPPEYRDA